MNRSIGSLLTAILTIAATPAWAQWLNVPTKGIPRTKDGKPDLSAPAPRKPDGKPDLSGIWLGDPRDEKYLHNAAADFKPGELPIQPWAEALSKERTDADASGYPGTRCLPAGIPIEDTQPFYPHKIIHETDLVIILNELRGSFRQIFLDGREQPEDANPTWWGYSVGRWDGDTLVVETTGFNGKVWLDDRRGHPSTDALHITERYRRRDFGHLDLALTINDPKAYTKPWMVTLSLQVLADTELLEYVCENERDLKHMVGK
jgi:hypothetical protein